MPEKKKKVSGKEKPVQGKKPTPAPEPEKPQAPETPKEEVCEFCGTVATKPEEYCSHLKAKHGLPLKMDGKEQEKGTVNTTMGQMPVAGEKPEAQPELPGMPDKTEAQKVAEDILDLRDDKKALNDKMKLLTSKFVNEMRLIQMSYLLVKGWEFDVELQDKVTITKKK